MSQTHQQFPVVQSIQCPHEVVTAGHLLRGDKDDFDAWRSLLKLLHNAARLLIVLCATQVAALNACLLQVEDLEAHRHRISTLSILAIWDG